MPTLETWGTSEDGKRALVLVTPDTGRDAYMAIYPVLNGQLAYSGRWECSPEHVRTYEQVYRARFPH